MVRIAPPLSLLMFLTAATGCGEGDGNDASSIGHSVGRNVTEFAQGVGTGVDQQLEVEFEVSPALAESGISATVAKQDASLNSPDKSISVYFIAEKAISGIIVAKAYNSDGQEVGRATTTVEFADDDAQYIRLEFPSEMDRQTVAIYKFSLQERPGDQQEV